jgi:predicted O-methyltransferase YrrM
LSFRQRDSLNPYLNANDTAALVALIASVEPKVMLEIGCNTGRTAATVLDAVPSIERYIGVDVPFGFKTALACQRSEVPLEAGHFVAEHPRFWLLLCERGSAELAPADLEPVDAVFIDGDHSAQGVMHDSELARALVREGGIIVWHDAGNPHVEVDGALDELRNREWPIVHVENSWIAFCRT